MLPWTVQLDLLSRLPNAKSCDVKPKHKVHTVFCSWARCSVPCNALGLHRVAESFLCDLAELQAVACHDEGRGGVASVSGLLRSAPGCPKRWLFALSSVRYAMVWCGFRVCYRAGGCTQKGCSYGGLVVKSCAIPVWKLSFVLILGPWPHIGPVPGATLRCLWGPGSLPS